MGTESSVQNLVKSVQGIWPFPFGNPESIDNTAQAITKLSPQDLEYFLSKSGVEKLHNFLVFVGENHSDQTYNLYKYVARTASAGGLSKFLDAAASHFNPTDTDPIAHAIAENAPLGIRVDYAKKQILSAARQKDPEKRISQLRALGIVLASFHGNLSAVTNIVSFLRSINPNGSLLKEVEGALRRDYDRTITRSASEIETLTQKAKEAHQRFFELGRFLGSDLQDYFNKAVKRPR